MSKKPKMIMCRNCNTQIVKDAKICPSCGAKNKKPIYKRVWFILLVIVAAMAATHSIKKSDEEKFDWKEVELAEQLPKPKSSVGMIIINDSDNLDMMVEKTSKSDYKAYIKECQSMGYTIESENNGDYYDAFDENGYDLSLNIIGETMYIKLEAPMEMGTLNWPKSEIVSLLPVPKSTVGKVSWDTTDSSYIYVGNTSIEDFNAYIDECSDVGFSVDYQRGDSFYYADDKNGNQLSLDYEGNNIMLIVIEKTEDAAKEVENAIEETVFEPEDEILEEEVEAAKSEDTLSKEFKDAMDSYEAFMNEYCEFMEKYSKSDGTDLGLVADYAKYMTKYAEMVADFESWNDEEMSMAELEYYMEVQSRVSQKLLQVAG